MTYGSAIGPINHFVGNGATLPTAPPTLNHLGMHDVSARIGQDSFVMLGLILSTGNISKSCSFTSVLRKTDFAAHVYRHKMPSC